MIAATPAHADVLAAIHAAAFPPAERWGSDAMAVMLGLHGTFGLLDPAGAMVLARVAADEAEVLTVATLPALRRQGRAAALLTAAQARAARCGAAAMFLEVSEANAAARALYAGLGYVEVGRRARYYGPLAALTMRRGLA